MKKIYKLSLKAFALFAVSVLSSTAYSQYCTAGVGPNSTFDSNVEQVTLVGNSSTLSHTGCPGVAGVQNLTATAFTDLERGATYTIDITWGFCNNFSYTGFGKVWIDFNSDQVFDASEEIVAVSVPNASQPLAGTYTFTVPTTAIIGNTRMRVMQDEGGSTATTACEFFTWGSTMDFGIDIIDCSAGPVFSTISPTSCGYYTAPSGAQFHDAGTYTDTTVSSLGCDSIITINLSTNNTFSTQVITGICGLYTMPSGLVVGTDGIYTDTTTNAAGCDSVINYDLSFSNSTSAFTAEACDVYTAPSGAEYTISGTYNDTIMNAAGCDSVMTISLVMSYANSLTVFAETCGEDYVSGSGTIYNTTGIYIENNTSVNGCDSLVYINLVIQEGNEVDEIVSACDEYTSPSGVTYTSSGTYAETFQGATGCDSTINYIIDIGTVDNTASFVSAMTAVANEASVGTAYQWVDCNNNNALIPGATSQVYEASVNGDYACRVTLGDCIKLTNCIRLGSLSVDEESSEFSVFPNPSNGTFSVQLTAVTNNTKITVTNAAGQTVYQSALNNTKTDIDLGDVEAGVYVITISDEGKTAKRSVVVQ